MQLDDKNEAQERVVTIKEAKRLSLEAMKQRQKNALARRDMQVSQKHREIKNGRQIDICEIIQDKQLFVRYMGTRELSPIIFVPLAKLAQELTGVHGELRNEKPIQKIANKFQDEEPAVMYHMFLRIYLPQEQMDSLEFVQFEKSSEGKMVQAICSEENWDIDCLVQIVRYLLVECEETKAKLMDVIFS